ncbi:MAG: hypothetical protein WAM42_07490, partial [Candidatus Nitrosopolaris sp.]
QSDCRNIYSPRYCSGIPKRSCWKRALSCSNKNLEHVANVHPVELDYEALRENMTLHFEFLNPETLR